MKHARLIYNLTCLIAASSLAAVYWNDPIALLGICAWMFLFAVLVEAGCSLWRRIKEAKAITKGTAISDSNRTQCNNLTEAQRLYWQKDSQFIREENQP
jgi:hypothetical protein